MSLITKYLAFVLSVAMLNACGIEPEATTAGDEEDTPPDNQGGEVNELYVGVVRNNGTGDSHVQIRRSVLDGAANPLGTEVLANDCRIAPGATAPDNDIFCIVHVEEEDLNQQGVELRFNFPKAQCDYGVRHSSWYYNKQPGVGPDYIFFETIDGVVDRTTIQIRDGGASGTSVPSLVSVSDSGAVKCAFDYTTPSGQGENCCVGNYVINKIAHDTQAVPPTDTPSSTDASWGGDMGTCAAGHAADDGSPRSNSEINGVPIAITFPIVGTGITQTYKLPGMVNKQSSYSLTLANYFADRDPYTPSDWPIAFQRPSRGFSVGKPYLELHCLNRAREVSARIRVMVMDWNTVDQFDSFVSGNGGNPDLDEPEVILPEFGTEDFPDWLKVTTATSPALLINGYPYDNVATLSGTASAVSLSEMMMPAFRFKLFDNPYSEYPEHRKPKRFRQQRP